MKQFLYISILFSLSLTATAQTFEENNGSQIAAIRGGGEKINKAISKQTTSQTKTDLLAGAIGTEWEGKYNSYLKTTQGYAQGLKGAAMLYAEGVTTLRHLYEITKAIKNNPQGLIASAAMSNVASGAKLKELEKNPMASISIHNLYADAAAELIKVYNVLKYTIAVGGKTNMLTGAERTELLWAISDSLQDFNRKLRQLALSISYYNMTDVWNRVTTGLVDRNHGEIARQAYKRWVRAQTAYHNYQ